VYSEKSCGTVVGTVVSGTETVVVGCVVLVVVLVVLVVVVVGELVVVVPDGSPGPPGEHEAATSNRTARSVNFVLNILHLT
jgi:hypothetical protein